MTAPLTTGRRTSWAPYAVEDVRALYDDYTALLDDGDHAGWLELFEDDALYLCIARENVERGLPLATIRCESRGMLADRLDTLTSTQFYARRHLRHVVSAIRPVGGDGEVLEVTASFIVAETIVGETTQLHASGSYADRVRAVDGALRFVEKVAIYDGALVATSLIVPL